MFSRPHVFLLSQASTVRCVYAYMCTTAPRFMCPVPRSEWSCSAEIWFLWLASGLRCAVAVTVAGHELCLALCAVRCPSTIYFASAAVAVDSGHMTASSSASWSRFSPPSNFVNGRLSTMWFMVCHWPQSREYFVQVSTSCPETGSLEMPVH